MGFGGRAWGRGGELSRALHHPRDGPEPVRNFGSEVHPIFQGEKISGRKLIEQTCNSLAGTEHGEEGAKLPPIPDQQTRTPDLVELWLRGVHRVIGLAIVHLHQGFLMRASSSYTDSTMAESLSTAMSITCTKDKGKA